MRALFFWFWERVHGQKGHMIIHEDGTIISSSGALASNETISQQVTSLMSHSLPVNFTQPAERSNPSTCALNGSMSGSVQASGDSLMANTSHSMTKSQIQAQNHNHHHNKPVKWSRVTVNFGDHSYMACLSNRRIHVVKRENGHDETGTVAH